MDLTHFVKRCFLNISGPRPARLFFFLLLASSSVVTAQRIILKEAATPIAERPAPESRVIAVLTKGDTIRVLKINNPWMQVAFRGKQKGWIYVGRSTSAAAKSPAATSPAEAAQTPELAPPMTPPATFVPNHDGGISFHLGSFSRQFTYVGKFYYRTMPRLYVEGTFQYVAGNIASNYLMHGNAKYVRPLGRRLEGTATVGVGVINSVPVRAAGVNSVSNMAFNYGIGVQRYLKNNNWLRVDMREYTVLRNKQGLANFFEFIAGIAIGISWSKI